LGGGLLNDSVGTSNACSKRPADIGSLRDEVEK
jgi:hypothetical protein